MNTPAFLEEVSFMIPGHAEKKFSTPKDLLHWIEAEETFWTTVNVEKVNGNVKSAWRQEISFFNQAKGLAQEFERKLEKNQENEARQLNQQLQQHVANVSNGNIITSDHDFYPAIVDLAKISPESAAILLSAARSDAINKLGAVGNFNLPLRSIFELMLQYGRAKGTRDWLQPQRKELAALEGEYRSGLDQVRAAFDQQESDISLQKESAANSHQARIDEWEQRKLDLSKEWDDLKRVYDEKLALLAPTQYWADRAKTHRNIAIGFAIAFGLILVASVWIFAWLAMPHLFAVAGNKDVSPILTLIPVAVPAFAGIWVLKMLSRLLSENLQMMRDAKERETMVKTFLALMRDDTAGKSLVKDDDRILILHSLFRPSSVSAVDDAPPVHWFDILTNKVSGKSRAGA
jgi:hypothetical protein